MSEQSLKRRRQERLIGAVIQMSPDAHTTNSAATFPKALSNAATAAGASAAAAGTVAPKIRASTICPSSPRILAENSTSACGVAGKRKLKAPNVDEKLAAGSQAFHRRGN